MNVKKAVEFVEAARAKGYDLGGCVLKIDFTGDYWRVGFWIRPCRLNKHGEYDLPGLCGSAKDADLEKAIDKAIYIVSR